MIGIRIYYKMFSVNVQNFKSASLLYLFPLLLIHVNCLPNRFSLRSAMNQEIFTTLRDYAKDVTFYFVSVAFYATSLVIRIIQSKNRNLLLKPRSSFRKKRLAIIEGNSIDHNRIS